jgi:hypothetical protein
MVKVPEEIKEIIKAAIPMSTNDKKGRTRKKKVMNWKSQLPGKTVACAQSAEAIPEQSFEFTLLKVMILQRPRI